MPIDVASPFAEAANQLRQFLVEREIKRRQDMADEMMRRREERLLKSTDASIANTTAQTEALNAQREAQEALTRQTIRDRVSAHYAPGDVIDPGDEGQVVGDAQMTLPGRSLDMTTGAPGQEAPMVPGVVMSQDATGRKVARGTPEQRKALNDQAALRKAQEEAIAQIKDPARQAAARAVVASGGKFDLKDLIDPEMQDVYSVNPRTGKVEKIGSVPKGSHFSQVPGESATIRMDNGMTPTSEANFVLSMQRSWDKTRAAEKEMNRQMVIMQEAMNRFNADPVGGSEGVRVTFEKILDPISVVREGEYARQGQGLSLLHKIEGLSQKYLTGGGPIPRAALEEMVKTAQQFTTGLKDFNTKERKRMEHTADRYRIPHDVVFGPDVEEAAPEPPPSAGPSAQSVTPPPGAKVRKYNPATKRFE